MPPVDRRWVSIRRPKRGGAAPSSGVGFLLGFAAPGLAFGSIARGRDFDPDSSDADFLVTFESGSEQAGLARFLGLAEALEVLLHRPVDLVERSTIEASRNYIRKRSILSDVETVYG